MQKTVDSNLVVEEYSIKLLEVTKELMIHKAFLKEAYKTIQELEEKLAKHNDKASQ